MKNKLLLVFVLIALPLNFYGKSKTLENFNKGLDCQAEENFYLASQYYLEVVQENPAFSDAWYNLAVCSYKLGEFNLALQYLEDAQKLEKKTEYENLRGLIYVSTGKMSEATQIFNIILKQYPNDVDAHFGLAEIELYEGRFSGAEKQYTEALRRQNTNRKALLSLALVSAENQKYDEAEKFLRQALAYYSSDAEVQYLAAIIASMKGDYKSALSHASVCVELNSNFDKGYELLSTICYNLGDFNKVLNLSDYLIGHDRNNSNAWYLKGLAYEKLGQTSNAIDVWTTGLTINPQDELMRSMMEMEIRDNLSLEDKRRSDWAKYHITNAKQYQTRYEISGSTYEYQRALMLDPMNYDARISYANLLELNGMYELYLEQLNFIKEHNYENITNKQKTDLTDKIEAYDSLLINTIGKKWNVEPFYLDKTRWNIAVFYEDTNKSFVHADSNRLVAKAAADIFNGVAITSVKTQVSPVSGYGEAFKNARSGKFDYFVILSLSESQNDITLKSSMYSARTGLAVTENSFYATGNNRFSTVLRRFRNSVLDKLTVRGKILDRNGKIVLVDLGKSEKITEGAKFKIIKKNQVKTSDNGIGLAYKDADVLGTLTITKLGEEISEAEIEQHGFYDRININDEIVLVYLPEEKADSVEGESPIDNVPGADENGNTVIVNKVEGTDLVDEIKHAVERPAILELLRNIY